jgi:hypothetical protein
MTSCRSYRRGKKDCSDHDQAEWIRIAEFKWPMLYLLKQKQNADGDDDRRAHQAADGASRAAASPPNSVAHLDAPPIIAAELVAQHQRADSDQDQGPESFDPVERQKVEIIQQKDRSSDDQDDWANGALLAPGL